MHPKVKSNLEKSGFIYKVYLHKDFIIPVNSPIDFANGLNYDIARIVKSILLKSTNTGRYIMAVCSSNKRIDFNILKDIIGAKKIVVASVKELDSITGYPIKGVSPIGVSEDVLIIIDKELLIHKTILIGSGSVGIEIEISPNDLLKITTGTPYFITTKL